MVLVLIGILVILQVHLNLVVHLRRNLIAEQASNNRNDTEAQTAERRSPKTNNVRLLEGSANRTDDLGCDSRDLSDSLSTEGPGREERRHRVRGEAGSEGGSGHQLCSFGGLDVCEDSGVHCVLD